MNKQERNEYVAALSTMGLIGVVIIIFIVLMIKSMI